MKDFIELFMIAMKVLISTGYMIVIIVKFLL